MSDSCRKYVENELNLLKDRLENINNEIHSSNIELKTIDKNIKKLNKEKDWTEDIFHSVTSSTDTSVVAIEALKNNKKSRGLLHGCAAAPSCFLSFTRGPRRWWQ